MPAPGRSLAFSTVALVTDPAEQALGQSSAEMTVASAAEEPGARHRRPPASGRAARWTTVAILISLMAGSVVAHNVHRMLTQPLWRDENWVAVTLRAPLSQILRLTSTTPVLFTALLRLTPHATPSGLRVLPLAFTAASVVPAWFLGRVVEPSGWTTRIALAAGVAFAPALLLRHDLKQYTAEAFATLVTLWLLARLEACWTRRRLLTLAAVLASSTLLANSAMFLGPAVLLCLGLVLLVRWDLRHLREVALVGAATLAVDLGVMFVVDRPGDTPSLRTYWDGLYVPTADGLADALHFIHFQAGAELQNVGLGPSLGVAALVLLGMVTLARTGFSVLALVVPATTLEQLGTATAHLYPLWDQRTSTWFSVLLTVMAVIGLTGLARLGWALVRRSRRAAGTAAGVAIGLVVVAVVVALSGPYLQAARTAVDSTTPLEDVHGQVQTIEAQWRPGDVVVANADAGFGLGVYWPAQPLFVFGGARLETFRLSYPPADRVVVAATISTAAEVAAVRAAVAMAAATPKGRVWVVLSHWHTAERATMISTVQHYGTLSTPPGQHGLQPVQLLTLRRPVPKVPTVEDPGGTR